MRRTFLTSGDPQVEDKRWYVLQNWRQDPVAILDEARRPPRTQRERVFFSPYGRIFGLPATRLAGDTGFDGDYGAGDSTAISGWSTAYQAYADVDLDGDIDATDATFSTNVGMGWDKLSRDGSTIGDAGYVQDDYVATVNHVRHRVLKTDLGRWIQRDPAGYVDGASLYEYSVSQPLAHRDAYGLSIIITPDALRLIRHFFYGKGATFRLTGAMLQRYLACPNVGRSINIINSKVEAAGKKSLDSAIQSIDCDCRTPLPSKTFFLIGERNQKQNVLRPPLVQSSGGGRFGTAVVDLCFLIGGHHIWYDYACGIGARCHPFRWSPPGTVAGGFACGINFRMRDTFEDVSDLRDLYRKIGFVRTKNPVIDQLIRSLPGIRRRIDSAIDTPYLIMGSWVGGVSGTTTRMRPYGYCEGGI